MDRTAVRPSESSWLRLVVTPTGDAVPKTTPRIGYVAVEPRDEVDVGVHHCLPSCDADMQTDVESVWVEVNIEGDLRLSRTAARISGCSSSLISKNEATSRLGITRVWPGNTG
jgi:hypothetical protein